MITGLLEQLSNAWGNQSCCRGVVLKEFEYLCIAKVVCLLIGHCILFTELALPLGLATFARAVVINC